MSYILSSIRFYAALDHKKIQFAINALILFAITCFAIFLFAFLWKKRRLIIMARQFKSASFSHPIFGIALGFIGTHEEIFQNIRKMGDAFDGPKKGWLGHKLMIGISRHDHVEAVLTHALEKSFIYNPIKKALGNGLLTAPVSIWKSHRKMIVPVFNRKTLDYFSEIFLQRSESLVSDLSKQVGNKELNVAEYLYNTTLDTILETLYGIPAGEIDTRTLSTWILAGMHGIFLQMFNFIYKFDIVFNATAMGKQVNDYLARGFKIILASADRAKEEDKLSAPSDEITKMISPLLIKHENGFLSRTDLKDEAITLVIAGSDTTALTSSYALTMLGMHPDIQERVYNEIIEEIGLSAPIKYADAAKLKYLDRCMKETMRLFPMGPMIGRYVDKDIKLPSGEILPAGSEILVCIINLHRSEIYYPDPLKFNPDRFLPEECSKRPPYSYLPFSGGPRNCVGVNYAMRAMPMFLASIIRNFKIHTHYKTVEEIRLKQEIILQPVEGFKVYLTKRT